jgi:hypothetical protein
MEWREPKIKGMVTPRNLFTALSLILVLSIPFGFIGGQGYSLSFSLIGFGFMSAAVLSMCIQPLLPGTKVRLTDNAIVRSGSRRAEKSPYNEIDCIYFYRNCSYSFYQNVPFVSINEKTAKGPRFTNFQVEMQGDSFVNGEIEISSRSSGKAHNFAVPAYVNLEQVLQILRDKGVKVVEPVLDPDRP